MINVGVIEIGEYICETPFFRIYKSEDLLANALLYFRGAFSWSSGLSRPRSNSPVMKSVLELCPRQRVGRGCEQDLD